MLFLKPQKSLKIEHGKITIDPSLLFVIVSLTLERTPNIQDYFDNELSTIPTSLTKENLTRKPYKTALANSSPRIFTRS